MHDCTANTSKVEPLYCRQPRDSLKYSDYGYSPYSLSLNAPHLATVHLCLCYLHVCYEVVDELWQYGREK